MKCTIKLSDNASESYPVLKQGQQTGMVVLFTAPKTGMILDGVDENRGHQVPGYVSSKWVESNFAPLAATAQVILSNG